MILNSDFLLPHFKEKMRQNTRDASRHVLCPDCKTRTRLYTLKDGRKKCSVCQNRFESRKKTDQTRLRQYADILLCFTLDFSAHRASQLSKIRYRLVSDIYGNHCKNPRLVFGDLVTEFLSVCRCCEVKDSWLS